ncbi:hypothetical protein [Sorangium sp. So ce233]|uniref:hypothetical protein n=1 Tax=Sorangium sp. So ce233 TaxID=3133290 RepID=UPI003F63232B
MNHLDALRYALADALYVAEGRYGTLELDVRLGLDDDDTSGWATELRRIRGEVEALLAVEFDAGRGAGCIESLRLIDELLAGLGEAPAVAEAA